jgi:hypothetical protein
MTELAGMLESVQYYVQRLSIYMRLPGFVHLVEWYFFRKFMLKCRYMSLVQRNSLINRFLCQKYPVKMSRVSITAVSTN